MLYTNKDSDVSPDGMESKSLLMEVNNKKSRYPQTHNVIPVMIFLNFSETDIFRKKKEKKVNSMIVLILPSK